MVTRVEKEKQKKIRNVRRIKEDYGYIPKRALQGSHTTVCQEKVHVLFLLRNNQSKMWGRCNAVPRPYKNPSTKSGILTGTTEPKNNL